ncbi:FIST C-terminal domain-containing protein [Leeia sp. TBRC 13508]|uniref:FIST C-terminal domain-containing protein n=1 Tax=Leeia speluncae TaxID=2884804 RepID=A0ABS8DA24_9NEIS|nr:FIST C-terminal domain-containing protein [Leeia speluncae]MCB6185054.1 FIST C-terminal domain-containing protein [Leeia speluncae]
MTNAAQGYFPAYTDALFSFLQDWKQLHPNAGVFAFIAEADIEVVSQLQKSCNQLGITLVGGVFPSVISSDGIHKRGICLINVPEMPPYFLLNQAGLGVAGERIAEQVLNKLEQLQSTDETCTLFLIFDVLIPDIASRLDDLYLKIEDRVNYAGLCAGSETFQPIASVFSNDLQLTKGLLAILWPETHKFIVQHGFSMPNQMLMATSTHGNRITQINWKPAFEAYQELIHQKYDVLLNKDNFYQYAVHYPLGLVRAADQIVVRIPILLDDDGALICSGEIPENAMLTLFQAPPPNPNHFVNELAEEISHTATTTESMHLVFYCAGRKMHMGEGAQTEIDGLYEKSGDKEMLGALTLGEIGTSSVGGQPVFHNMALVVCELSHE